MKYPSPAAHRIPSLNSPQLLENNYSLFMFHVFYISSFGWQCNEAFLHKFHKVYPSVVRRLKLLSTDQTKEKLSALTTMKGSKKGSEVLWNELKVCHQRRMCIWHWFHSYCGRINIKVSQIFAVLPLMGVWCTVSLTAGLCLCTVTSTESAFDPH